ncbi:perilipin-2-like isoform X2 [Rhinatrema bivittatum]|nr:perilipin-2-like isoform X2 [Rhinatrema bivittatum]
MASVVDEPQQSVVMRVANLPLVSSTCDLVSSAYISTKENHPHLKSVCEVAEKGVKIITTVAFTSAKPIIQKLQPQIALANNCACISLDKVEEKLPVLHQTTDKIITNATDMMACAKKSVAHTVTGMVDKTKGAVQESLGITQAAVTGSINAVLKSHMAQMVSTGVDAVLSRSDAFVDHYLPETLEAAKEATGVGFEAGTQKLSYYTRLGSLSSKLHRRAYEKVLARVKDAKCRSQGAISMLLNTYLYMESQILAIVQDLSLQLQTTSLTLISSIQGFTQNIQNKAHHISRMAGNVYQNFSSTTSFNDVRYYLSIPLKWLVNSFNPQVQYPVHAGNGEASQLM